MSLAAIEQVARAILHEGFLLYPYRGSALKNRHRWTFGGLAPPAWAESSGEPSALQTECLIEGPAEVEVRVRFLQVGGGSEPEAVERELVLERCSVEVLLREPLHHEATFPELGWEAGAAELRAAVRVEAVRVGSLVARLSVRVENRTAPAGPPDRERAARCTLASTHALVLATGGRFVSQSDPPEHLREAAAGCRQQGAWPVLVGAPDACQAVLASPIILPDFPAVAPESPGDLFDATEIDEILTLRILTLTEEEKAEVRAAGGPARRLLERTEALGPDELLRLHGTARSPSGPARGSGYRVGDRVRVRPRHRADALDLMLAGRAATVVAVERDLEDRVYLAVTVDDDPGADLAREGQVGHRFFFQPDEVEPR